MKQLGLLLTGILTLSAATASAESISLKDYLKAVDAENLQLRASRASVDASDARAVGVRIPEPMVGFMRMTDSSGGSNGIEVFQTIPFPTKLLHDHSARRFEAAAEKTNAQRIRIEILAEARLIYFNVWATQSRVQLLKEKKTAVQEHLRLSRASTRSDSSLRIHTLKAESDSDLLENDIIEAEQRLRENQIQLASFAKKDLDQYKPDVSEPPMADMTIQDHNSSPRRLETKRLNFEMLTQRESEAKSSWFPDLNLRYRQVGSTPMTPGYQEVMIGATLPFLFFWEPNAKSKSATAEKLKAEADYQQEKISSSAKVASLIARAESLKKQINLIQTKLLPRAEKRMHLVHNLAPRDMESLQDHREGMEEFPDLKLKSLDLRTKYEETIAELAALSSETN